MARYLGISPLQEPFDGGLDGKARAQVMFNVLITKTPSTTVAEELIKILTDAGVGVEGTDIFFSSRASVPDGEGPFLSLIEQGGAAPGFIHNQDIPAYPSPGAQIVVRAKSYTQARAMAWAAYNALVVVRNQVVTP